MPGLYIHVPFCDGKCPYCDFYSLPADSAAMDAYTERAAQVMAGWAGAPCISAKNAGNISCCISPPVGRGNTTLFPANACGGNIQTVYFGGGTPNLLGAERLARLLGSARENFPIAPDAEVTVEANPTHVDRAFFADLRAAGFNRLSMGLQSANEEELALLGRQHTPADAARAVKDAQSAGFRNISLDLMLALPGGSQQKLKRSIDFAAGLGVQHISSYILKVEEGTAFARRGVAPPEDDEAASQYLFCVEELARQGFAQYEISNFARPGLESRHNLTYWRGEEYLGVGPGAHSFWEGRRFYFPRDLRAFLAGCGTVPDGEGGSFEEFAMLNLRLARGLVRADCAARFGPEGEAAFARMAGRAKACPPRLVEWDSQSLRFTPEGFLVSNALLLRLLDGV